MCTAVVVEFDWPCASLPPQQKEKCSRLLVRGRHDTGALKLALLDAGVRGASEMCSPMIRI